MAWENSAKSDESSLFSRSSSWEPDAQDEQVNVSAFQQRQRSTSSEVSEENDNQHTLSPIATRQSRHYSFAEHAQEESGEEDGEDVGESSGGSSSNGSVPAEKERQLLLLMLLAQVCSLHDPTPKTFTVHVLELFERGILDRQSILFLFELGLVPSTSPNRLLLPPPAGTESAVEENPEIQQNFSLVNTANASTSTQHFRVRQRTAEASAIRMSLEQQERQQRQQRFHKCQSEPIPHQRPASWAAKHHPLSLSRYQREFEQQYLLSSGAFGQVFKATSNMDGRDYAVKRIPFSASGYSRDSVQAVVREVHCLAICDHPNVVRYFTSWLEPSWMTGSGASSVVVDSDQHQKLLKDITHMVAGNSGDKNDEITLDASRRIKAYFEDESHSKRPRRRFSFDTSDNSWDLDQSEWTINAKKSSFSKDDLYAEDIFERSKPSERRDNRARQSSKQEKGPQQKRNQNYRYQICLFIQMQLCHTSTLADWIRERNNNSPTTNDIKSRLGPVREIFCQITQGLKHVHQRNIVHRDLKPANIFATVDGELQFKIGDFGLSKMIRSAATGNQHIPTSEMGTMETLLLSSFPAFEGRNESPQNHTSHCNSKAISDPMTAGVGTASYASPEQISSKSYGKAADIYSLGLILLELICSFGTEHERYQTFHDCRHQRKLPQEVNDELPLLAEVILACTEPVAFKRPSAEQLSQIDLLSGHSNTDEKKEKSTSNRVQTGATTNEKHQIIDASDPENLRKLLVEKEERIGLLEDEIRRKDQIIADLRVENSLLSETSVASSNVYTYPIPAHGRDFQNDQDNSSSSSSEEEL